MSFHKYTYCLFGGWGWSSKILFLHVANCIRSWGIYGNFSTEKWNKKICALGSVHVFQNLSLREKNSPAPHPVTCQDVPLSSEENHPLLTVPYVIIAFNSLNKDQTAGKLLPS